MEGVIDVILNMLSYIFANNGDAIGTAIIAFIIRIIEKGKMKKKLKQLENQ